MKKFCPILILLILVISAAMGGCKAEKSTPDPRETELPEATQNTRPSETEMPVPSQMASAVLVGEWIGQTDYAEYLNASMKKTDPETAEYLSLTSYAISWKLEFSADGSYSLSADPETMKATHEKLHGELLAGLTKMIEKQISESEEKITVQDVEKQMGTTISEMAEEIAAAVKQSMDLNIETGKYRLEDDRLMLDNNEGALILKLEPETFTFTEYTGEDDAGMFKTFFCGIPFQKR